MNLDAVRERLEGVTGSGPSFTARCPAHDDRDPSLSVADKGDRIVIHCHAGCETRDVLEAMGLSWSDVFSESANRERFRPTLRVSQRRQLAKSYAVDFTLVQMHEDGESFEIPSDAEALKRAERRLKSLAERYGMDEFQEIAKSWEDADCYCSGPEVRKAWPLSAEVVELLPKEQARGR